MITPLNDFFSILTNFWTQSTHKPMQTSSTSTPMRNHHSDKQCDPFPPSTIFDGHFQHEKCQHEVVVRSSQKKKIMTNGNHRIREHTHRAGEESPQVTKCFGQIIRQHSDMSTFNTDAAQRKEQKRNE